MEHETITLPKKTAGPHLATVLSYEIAKSSG
jgi:hypothetical protein